MTNAAEAKPKMPIKKLDAVLCHLEHLQQRVMDSADNAEINHAKDSAAAVEGLNEEEREDLEESRMESIKDFAGKWMEYSEYITVEFDTEAGTATVVPRK